MEKCAAFMNAQSVWAWATFFGHGDVVSLTKYSYHVDLEMHFPRDKFNKDREDAKIRNVTTAGANFRWYEYPEEQIDVLHITWSFD